MIIGAKLSSICSNLNFAFLYEVERGKISSEFCFLWWLKKNLIFCFHVGVAISKIFYNFSKDLSYENFLATLILGLEALTTNREAIKLVLLL